MEQIELRALEARCIQEEPPPCQATCPVHVDVRALAGSVGKGNFAEGLAIFRRTIPFPHLVARICDEPCRSLCTRGAVGEPIQIRELELACVNHGTVAAEKPRQLPRRQGRVAVAGGGLSGMTAAFDLARKGYRVTLFEACDRLGGDLWQTPPDDLPWELINTELSVLVTLGVELRLGEPVNSAYTLRQNFDAVYVATGSGAQLADLPQTSAGGIVTELTTFATNLDGVFAGGALLRPGQPPSPITAIADGRRAAISIDRYLQKVSLTASRSAEGTQTTRLFTNTTGIVPLLAVRPARPADGFHPDEAVAEAARCLLCECMECVKVCPYLEHYDRYPRKGIREVYNNLAIVQGERKANRFINSCSLCGLCAEVCPTNLSMGTVCKHARQAMVRQGRMPPSAHDFALRDMAFSNGPQFTVARHQPGTTASTYVFFPGCQLSASTPEHVERVYADLRQRMGASVGLLLHCCGVPADWAGRPELFATSLAALSDQLRSLGNPTVILPCSSCYQTFKLHLPEIRIVSLWDLYAERGLPPDARTGALTVAVHDPCSTRYEVGIQEGARTIIDQLGYAVEELSLSRQRTTCCSYGGVQWLANPAVARKVVERRVAESTRDYVTYCAMCRDFFAAYGKRTLHLLDLIYGDDGRNGGRGPGFSQRHENRARLKRRLLLEVWGETMDNQASYEAIQLFVSDEIRARMEERHILDEDLRRVIEHAERTGARFHNQASGRWLASYKPTAVTYWVEYEPQGDGFLITNAYSHRMEIVEDHHA